VLAVKDLQGKYLFYVVPLQEFLEYPNPRNVWNFDEKPLFPDSPIMTGIGGPPKAASRMPIWTVGMKKNIFFIPFFHAPH
jgi:hypothetical protein